MFRYLVEFAKSWKLELDLRVGKDSGDPGGMDD